MIEAIIFDMDGVLIDSEPVYMNYLYEFLKEQGLTYPESVYHQKIGSSKSVADDLPDYNPSYDFIGFKEKMATHSKAFTMDYHQVFRKDWLNEFAYFKNQQLKMAIASSSPMKVITDLVKTCQLDTYFEAYVSGRDLKESKPAPDIFLLAAQKINVQPKNCLVIEDSHNGVLAGKAAGMKVIGLIDDRFEQDLEEADAKIKDIKDLRMFI